MLAANANHAGAQPAPGSRETAYTGDVVDGKRVISRLDDDSGARHEAPLL